MKVLKWVILIWTVFETILMLLSHMHPNLIWAALIIWVTVSDLTKKKKEMKVLRWIILIWSVVAVAFVLRSIIGILPPVIEDISTTDIISILIYRALIIWVTVSDLIKIKKRKEGKMNSF